MSLGGFADWYLPAVSEASILFVNRAELPVSPGSVWSSTESSSSSSFDFNASTGAQAAIVKNSLRAVQCIRKD
jgi:hypothetical protein